jgi:hypothetical protein
MSNKKVCVDKLGRTWKGNKIGWITVANSSNLAQFSWKKSKDDNKMKLVKDRKNGMYDYMGNWVKNTSFEKKPVLLLDEKNNWQHFPGTEEAEIYKKYLRYGDKSHFKDEPEDMDGLDEAFEALPSGLIIK